MSWTPKRQPEHLSNTALQLFEDVPEEFFIKYLADRKPPKIPQAEAMAAGASFDSYCKAAMQKELTGADTFTKLFEDAVEPHNRDYGLEVGKVIFDAYVLSGAYAELLALVKQSATEPRFESTVTKVIDGIPILGKPDLSFSLKLADLLIQIVHDWKVKGYASKYSVSPTKNYRIVRDGFVAAKQSKNNGESHNGYLAYDHHGFEINTVYMEVGSKEYAAQTSMYGWLLGMPVGSEDVAYTIDEIVTKNPDKTLRIANHRARVSQQFQLDLLERYRRCWKAVTSGHVFDFMSREDSIARCEILNDSTECMNDDDYFTAITRTQRFGG